MTELHGGEWESASSLGSNPDEVLATMKEEMRRWSLANLLEAFEAAVDQIAGMMSEDVFNPRDMKDPDYYLAEWGNISPAEPCEIRAAELARHYIIARDFNEFDPGKADMLWKLKYGGAI
ncbi:hypothetical protein F4U94_22810 [Sphingobium limneticum]|uniref:hypothetical protein n=1 Tax=Sphingobium limneticum TaxID=1007511 RepID=UPI00123CCFBE|nr:hypothetical protein [Sphingobium limneticum]KAA9009658.1 hypothetical protein F4U94_22810 [Sphingobium limneticum]